MHTLRRGNSNGRLTKAYNNRLPLSEAKIEDLRRLMEFLPPYAREFYQNLLF